MDNFLTRVVTLQKELKAPKSQKNSFGKYNYRSCEDILEAVKPLLSKYSVLLNVSDCLVLIGDRFYVKATATLYDTETDNCISSDAFAREPEDKKGMDESQITGTASSYARKYALNGLFCIDDNKDADTDEYAVQTDSNQAKKEIDAAIKRTEEPKIYKCENCGSRLFPETINGRTYQPDKIAVSSRNKFGKVLCKDCREIAEKQ